MFRFSMHSEEIALVFMMLPCIGYWCNYLGNILVINFIFMNKCITLALFKADPQEKYSEICRIYEAHLFSIRWQYCSSSLWFSIMHV